MNTKNIRLTPGSMGVVALAYDLFGPDRLIPGSWGFPVWVCECTEEEIEFAREFFAEYGVTVTPTDERP